MSDGLLVSNLLLTFKDSLDGLSEETKDRILKERISIYVDKIIEYLNEIHDDIYFSAKWSSIDCEDGIGSSGIPVTSGFDEHRQSDIEYDDCLEDDSILFNLPAMSVENLSIRVDFIRSQKCSLGHTHKNKRFYYYSIPRIMEIISNYLHNPRWKENFTKKHIPNFFGVEK